MKKYYKKVWFWLLIIFIVLPAINYCVFDFGSLAFCDYKSIVGNAMEIQGTYDLRQVAVEARKNGVQADILYIGYGNQVPANISDLQKKYGFYVTTRTAYDGRIITEVDGPQVNLNVIHFGADYRAVLRYSDVGSGKIHMEFFDAHEKAACMTPNLLVRFFAWKMFVDSGLQTSWLWHTWIHHVIYWGPEL